LIMGAGIRILEGFLGKVKGRRSACYTVSTAGLAAAVLRRPLLL
jgi:hypothetical protein